MNPEVKEIVDYIIRAVEVILVPLLWRLGNSFIAVRDSNIELRTLLIGMDGKNGLRSRIERLENNSDRENFK
jgi:hypothetical protein